MNEMQDKEDLLTPEERNRLLLYWSGELGIDEATELEADLPQHPSWSAYLDELHTLAANFQPSDVARKETAPTDPLDKAIARFRSESLRSNNENRVVSLLWLKPLVAAAVIMLAFVLINQSDFSSNSKNGKVQIAENQGELAARAGSSYATDMASSKGRSRSSRLFASMDRSNLSRFDAARRQIQKLRTKIEKS